MDEPMVTLAFDRAKGLIPAIAQDESTGEVLMLASVSYTHLTLPTITE